jgi:hypothetical protein
MINRILIPISCNFFSGNPSPKNFKVKHAWPGAMGDRSGSSSRVLTSEDKVCRKDLCCSARAVHVLEKRPDVSGPGPASWRWDVTERRSLKGVRM